jgi:hypothetical protein
VTIDGYWIDNWIYWITISYTTRLQCITLYNSQLSLFSSSEHFGSSSATTAATNSYGIPCHHYPGNSTKLCTILTQCQSQSHVTTDDQSVSKFWFQGPWGSHDRIFISVVIYEYCFIDYGRPPLTRGRVCHLSVILRPLLVNIYRFTCNVHVSYKYTYI